MPESGQDRRMVEHGKFWAEVHRRALKDARRLLRLEDPGSLMILVIVFLIYALLVWHYVGATAATSEITDRLLATVAPILFAVMVYGRRLFMAPAEIHAEAVEKHDALADKVELLTSGPLLMYGEADLFLRATLHGERTISQIVSVNLHFENISDLTLNYKVARLEFEYKGKIYNNFHKRLTDGGIVYARKPVQFVSGDLITPFTLDPFPTDLIVHFDVEYDTIPQSKAHTVGRTMVQRLQSYDEKVEALWVTIEERQT
jgi:hypothetical protein